MRTMGLNCHPSVYPIHRDLSPLFLFKKEPDIIDQVQNYDVFCFNSILLFSGVRSRIFKSVAMRPSNYNSALKFLNYLHQMKDD